MRWIKEKRKKKNLLEWHKWYAWYPVTVKSGDEPIVKTRVWLETVERKYLAHAADGSIIWDYRFLKEEKDNV